MHIHCLTAWDINIKRRIVQQFPGFGVLYPIIEDKIVIVPMFLAPPTSMYVWDLSSNHIQRIGTFSRICLCHVDAAENVVVAFEICREKTAAGDLSDQVCDKLRTAAREEDLSPGASNKIP